MTRPPSIVAMAWAAAALAGCVGGGASPNSWGASLDAAPSASAAEFTDDTGAIHGIVVSDEQAPIAGATVGILGQTQATAQTAANGEFTLNKLGPGEVTVSVAALGFQSSAKKANVAVGQVTQVQFILSAVPTDAPYPVTIQRIGSVLCSVSFFPGYPAAGIVVPAWYTALQACGVFPTSTPIGENNFVQSYPVPKGTREVLVEMVWSSTQATGSGLSIWVEGSANDGHPLYGTTASKSPLRIFANETVVANVTSSYSIDAATSDWKIQSRTFSSANTTEFYLPTQLPNVPPFGQPSSKVDFGFAYNQRYTVYLTAFVHMTKPDGFSAVADS